MILATALAFALLSLTVWCLRRWNADFFATRERRLTVLLIGNLGLAVAIGEVMAHGPTPTLWIALTAGLVCVIAFTIAPRART